MTRLQSLRSHLEAHRFAVDLAVTVLLGLVIVPLSFGFHRVAPNRQSLWALALLAPLPWRRTRPVASAVAVFGVASAHLVSGIWFVIPADVAVLIALYSVTRYGPPWAGRVAMASVVAGAVLLLGLLAPIGAAGEALTLSAITVVTGLAVWAFALLRRSRQETWEALRDRAARLELERDQQAQLAAAAERARIAREMHDVVAHSLSVVIAQADGGRYAAEGSPEAARDALDTISETGRAALADVRRILGVLRTSSEDATGVVPPVGELGVPALTPQPVAADLDALVDRVRASGVHVSLVRVGEVRDLSPAMALAVHRICQEARTHVGHILAKLGARDRVQAVVAAYEAGLVRPGA